MASWVLKQIPTVVPLSFHNVFMMRCVFSIYCTLHVLYCCMHFPVVNLSAPLLCNTYNVLNSNGIL